MSLRAYVVIAGITLILTVIWVVLLVAAEWITGPSMTVEEAAGMVEQLGMLYNGLYLTGMAATIFATILLGGLYLSCRARYPGLSVTGLLFGPVYCALTLIVVAFQLGIVNLLLSGQDVIGPEIASIPLVGPAIQEAVTNATRGLVGTSLQQLQGSSVWALNGFRYAVLGISAVAFGIALIRRGGYASVAGIFLILNTVAAIIALAMFAAGSDLFTWGAVAAGILFIVALVFLLPMFYREAETGSREV